MVSKTQRVATRGQKGEAARDNLKRALVNVLDRMPYHRVRIVDVTIEAGVATGLFYHYFTDLHALVTEVLEDFIAGQEATDEIERDVARGDWFGRILSHYRALVRCYSRSPGLMRCMTDLSKENAHFRALLLRSHQRQLHQLVDLMPRIFPDSGVEAPLMELVVQSLGSIGQAVLREYYIEKRPQLRQLALDEEAMAEWLAVIFYRGLFASNPPTGVLHEAAGIVNLARTA